MPLIKPLNMLWKSSSNFSWVQSTMHISKKRTSLHNFKALPQLILISGIKVKTPLNFRQDSKSSNNVWFFLFTNFWTNSSDKTNVLLWPIGKCLMSLLSIDGIVPYYFFGIVPERIYNLIMAMGCLAMFTFQLENTKK